MIRLLEGAVFGAPGALAMRACGGSSQPGAAEALPPAVSTTFTTPAGTLVFVGDPALRRGAVATGTTIVTIGAAPGQARIEKPCKCSAFP